MATEDQIKRPISEILKSPPFSDTLIGDSAAVRERPLVGANSTFRSDFAFQTQDDGWFFIEDDDAMRCLSNFAKYWLWLERTSTSENVSLLHLIGPGYPGQVEILRFLNERARKEFPNFHIEIVMAQTWDPSSWRDDFRDAALRLPPFGKAR